MSIFKAYDIRGVYPNEIDEDIVYKIGAAFTRIFKVKNIFVGYDMRVSSPKLFAALTRGIADCGINVTDCGMVSTPFFYYILGSQNAEAGIMITASHNPKQYNGCKMCFGGTNPVNYATGLSKIESELNREIKLAGKRGFISKRNFMDDYIKFLLKFTEGVEGFKIVADAGNGMCGIETRKVFDKLNCKLIPMYFDPDGTFPNHEANPLKPENMKALQERVKLEKADIGIAFDGDGDRVMFVDENAEIIPSDLITAIIAQSFLKKEKGAVIAYDLRSSWAVKETIESNGGKALMCRVGHSFIKQQMRENNVIFAGELSGHMYFKDSYIAENSLLAAFKIMQLMKSEKKKLSELIKPLKKYFSSGEINFEVKEKEGKIREIEEIYSKGAANIFKLDGLSIEYNDWWFNVRPSNTEPVLRLIIEAKTKELMEQKKDEISRIIKL